MFSSKKILIGVTGGIAAYKTCELIRELKRHHADVRVVMTEAGSKFVTPLTLATLSEHPVLTDMFDRSVATTTVHIDLARWADVILICPATANTIAKIANGVADNLLTTLALATTSPIILCPAMNKEMYRNLMYVRNADQLKGAGYIFVESEIGELACGEYGWGRLAAAPHIIHALQKALLGTNEFVGKKVLVTAGRTEEPLDPVRFITNYSSGKMGFAVAEAAALRGAEVTLISGPNNLTPFDGIHYIEIQTSEQMAAAVEGELARQDIVIMAAAVADFKPAKYSEHKLKKNGSTTAIELERTTDILKSIGSRKENKFLVGFAVETEREIESAQQKLRNKNLDMIVLNNPLQPGAGFRTDTNIVTIIDKSGTIEQLPRMTKREVAVKIIDKIIQNYIQISSNRACNR